MNNLKDLRKNLDIFKKNFKDRNFDFDSVEFNRIDRINNIGIIATIPIFPPSLLIKSGIPFIIPI